VTRRDLIRALITGAGHLGCPMNGNHAYGDAAGLKHLRMTGEKAPHLVTDSV